eukprot:1120096-Prymnesium_polylepis.1
MTRQAELNENVTTFAGRSGRVRSPSRAREGCYMLHVANSVGAGTGGGVVAYGLWCAVRRYRALPTRLCGASST